MIRKFLNDERGNMGLMLAGSLLTIIIATGAALDLTALSATQQKAQNSVDFAALAAAKRGDLDAEDLYVFAKTVFTENMNFKESDVLNFGADRNSDGVITATARINHKLFFGGFLGTSDMPVTVISEVGYKGEPAPAAPCIMTLDANASPGLLLNSGAQINAPECEVHVHSTRNPAVTVNSGTTLNVEKTCVAGSNILTNSGPVDRLETDCEVDGNPYAGVYPVPTNTSCQYSNGNYDGSDRTMSPGVYCGWHNFNSNANTKTTFLSGTYIIKNGGWNVNNGEWIGDGVTFYFYDTSKIQFNSAVKADLKAPSTGDYAGVIMTEREGLSKSQFILNDSRGFDAQGVIYLPSREFVMNSASTLTGRNLNLVVNSMIVNQANLDIVPVTSASSTTMVADANSMPHLLR